MKRLTKKATIIGSSILLLGTVGTITGLTLSNKNASNDALLIEQKTQTTRTIQSVKPEIVLPEINQNDQNVNNTQEISTVDSKQKDKTEIIIWVLAGGSTLLILLAACIFMAKKIKHAGQNTIYNN